MGKITFLGTGGGRMVTINQTASTGGIILEMDGQMIHIDPGPGALVRAKQYGVNLKKLTGLVVSHAHPDHYTDAEVVIESITMGAKIKRGFLVSTPPVIKGTEKESQKISNYHLKSLEVYRILKPGDAFETGKIRITATPTKHEDNDGIGLVFEGEKKIGFTGDGEYFDGQEEYYRGCNFLLLNVMRPEDDPWPNHMNAGQAKTLIEKVKPQLAVLAGLGMKMLFGRAKIEAQKITKETGVKTIPAKDGMVLDLENTNDIQGLKKFLD